MTHPYHPLHGQQFELVTRRHTWGLDRVYYYDTHDVLQSLPAAWTTAVEPDPFVTISAGRSWLKFNELAKLSTLLQELSGNSE